MLFAFGQITLEHTYNFAGYNPSISHRHQLYIVALEVDSNKYVCIDRTNKVVKFYNLNHTLWKTLSFAAVMDLNSNSDAQPIIYISQHLFDLDDEIEFLYVDEGPSVSVTQIVNEDGIIIFTVSNQAPFVFGTAPQQQFPIYNTSMGTKMILSGTGNDANAYVYSLSGTLMAGITANLNEYTLLKAYPNPANSFTKIDYTLPEGISNGEIVFYDLQGKETKRFNVDKTFENILISTEDLKSGVYYYNLQTIQGVAQAKKLVIIK